MIFTAGLAGQGPFVFSKPLLYFAVAVANVSDVDGFINPIPASHVFPLVLASFFGVFVRHGYKHLRTLGEKLS